MSLTDSLISFWNLDETSGSRVDSWGTNTLTDNNTVTSAAGKIDNAAQCTAANSEFLSHADNTSLNTGNIDWTIAAWVYADTLSATRGQIISKDGTDAQRGYQLDYQASVGKFRFFVSNLDASSTATADNTTPSTATWYCIIAWHDSVNDLIGISVNDNTAVTTAFSAGTGGSTGAFYLGAVQRNNGAGGEEFWNGRIDLVGFWKKVLSAADRTAFYNSGAGVAIRLPSGALLMGSH